jgi:CRP-like cAMP-binding protein
MFDSFVDYLKGTVELTEEELSLIESLAIRRLYRKKDFLLKEGEVCRYRTFICGGCLRIYRVGRGGTEHISRFAAENGWVCDRESVLNGKPATNNIDALENTYVLQWTRENFNFLLEKIPAYRSYHEEIVSEALLASTERIYQVISLSAEEKYLQFIHKHPNIHARVPLYMVASYLGVARETLTRIRIAHFTTGNNGQ